MSKTTVHCTKLSTMPNITVNHSLSRLQSEWGKSTSAQLWCPKRILNFSFPALCPNSILMVSLPWQYTRWWPKCLWNTYKACSQSLHAGLRQSAKLSTKVYHCTYLLQKVPSIFIKIGRDSTVSSLRTWYRKYWVVSYWIKKCPMPYVKQSLFFMIFDTTSKAGLTPTYT